MAEAVVTSACYFPPAIFFKDYLQASKILLDAHEYFVKQTFRNRTCICGANGKFSLIVPVKRTSGKLTSVQDIQVSYDAPWQKTHWRSITSAYRNSPYFEFFEDELAPLFASQEKFLLDLNLKILIVLFKILGRDDAIGQTEKYIPEYPAGIKDLRYLTDPQVFFSSHENLQLQPYPQVFVTDKKFIPGLSILDLLFNTGRDFAALLS